MMLARLNHTLYLAMKNVGLYEWNGENFTSSPNNDPNLIHCQLLFTYDDRLWVGTTNGLFQFDRIQWQKIEIFDKKNITAVYTQSNIIWIATQNDGLYAYQPQDQNYRQFLTNSAPITSIFSTEKILFAGMYKGD